jgi:hypothetical protein
LEFSTSRFGARCSFSGFTAEPFRPDQKTKCRAPSIDAAIACMMQSLASDFQHTEKMRAEAVGRNGLKAVENGGRDWD